MRAKLLAVQKREFRGAALSFQVTLQQPCSRDHHDGPQIRGQETTADFTASPGPDAVTVGYTEPTAKTHVPEDPLPAFRAPWKASQPDAWSLRCMVSRCAL